MPEHLTKEQRSRNMSRVKNRDTAPEIKVRRLLHKWGFRFRLHRKDLPGSPDIVLPRFHKVIFVHGCFWHGHDCPRGKRPASNQDFWNQKLDRNLNRDRAAKEELQRLGWDSLVIWECEIKDLDRLTSKIITSLQEIREI